MFKTIALILLVSSTVFAQAPNLNSKIEKVQEDLKKAQTPKERLQLVENFRQSLLTEMDAVGDRLLALEAEMEKSGQASEEWTKLHAYYTVRNNINNFFSMVPLHNVEETPKPRKCYAIVAHAKNSAPLTLEKQPEVDQLKHPREVVIKITNLLHNCPN